MSTPLTDADVAAIERATLDAVPPQAVQTLGGWLLALDHGTVGRAHSAVPLGHDPAGPAAQGASLAGIEAVYAAQGLRTVLRLPMLPAFDAWAEALRRAGYAQGKPTSVWTGTADAVLARVAGRAASPPAAPASLLAQPDEGWRAVFLGEGFDPVDGASRVAILARARHAAFACVRDASGGTVAAGMGSYSHGWASIHGMRTLAAWRGQGLASAILRALAAEAVRRGIERMFLQVEQGNAGARSLYAGLGFVPAWDYAYWSRG